MSLRSLAELSQIAPGQFEGAWDPSWNQGPGAFGGLVAATLGRCLERTVDDPRRPIRTMTLNLCAPVRPGPFTITAQLDRAGTAVSFASARLEQRGTAVVATAMLARDRSTDLDRQSQLPPELPDRDSMVPMPAVPPVPAFIQHFDLRIAEGVPYGGGEARSRGWLQPREGCPLDAPTALGLLDVWPLAILPQLAPGRGATSVVITFQLFGPWPVTDGPFIATTETREVAGGYAEQRNRVWTAEGILLGQGTQTVAILR